MIEPLIQFRNVDVCLDGQRVLAHLTWQLLPAQRWAVLGGNGAGKSTFLRLIRGELSPAPGKGERTFRIDGKPQRTAVGVKEAVPLVAPETQDRYLQLDWNRRVEEVVLSGVAGTDYLFRKPTAGERHCVHAMMRRFGIDQLRARNVQELSTGELRRVLIARALAGRPKILLLDEVCDGLDAPARRALLTGLDQEAQAGLSIIYTTHRLGEILPSTTNIAILEGGQISWQGPAREVTPPAKTTRTSAGQITRSTGTYSPVRRVGSNGPLVRISGASVFLERRRVLHDVSWELGAGENWAVFGPNGSGKTTFLKLVSGDIHPAAGARVERFDLGQGHTLWDIRRRIGFVSPHLQANYRENLTGAQIVASGFHSSIGLVARVTRKQAQRVGELFETFGMSALQDVSGLKMSYGEFRKVLLLRALVHNPALLICDEPFDGLDAEMKGAFSAALETLAGNGTRLLTVTHHLEDVPTAITHALLLEKGRIVCKGRLERVRRHSAMERLFGDE